MNSSCQKSCDACNHHCVRGVSGASTEEASPPKGASPQQMTRPSEPRSGRFKIL